MIPESILKKYDGYTIYEENEIFNIVDVIELWHGGRFFNASKKFKFPRHTQHLGDADWTIRCTQTQEFLQERERVKNYYSDK